MVMGRQKAPRFAPRTREEISLADREDRERIIEEIILLEEVLGLETEESPALRLVSYRT